MIFRIKKPFWGRRSKALKNTSLFVFCLLLGSILFLSISCATPYLRGTTPEGQKVYLGRVPIEPTAAYQMFLNSSQSEAAKLDYLLQRIKTAQDLVYLHEGSQYNWLEAYRAGSWLLRHHYERAENARHFIQKEVWRYQAPGKPNAIKFPEGSIHLLYYVLLNELDLLEETLQVPSPAA